MTLVSRQINLSFVLGTGPYGEGSPDAVEITGLRTSAVISRQGGVTLNSLSLRVWGMPLDVMRKLSVLNILAEQQTRRNVITVTAGDADRGYGIVFSGDIINAWVDANASPDVCFVLTAFEGQTDKVRPVIPNSWKGPASVETLMGSIARQMQPPRNFENHGVDVVIDNGYYPGTLVSQMQQIAEAAQCEHYLDSTTLAIWPRGKARGDAAFELSAATGLVGYPQFSQTGVSLTTLFSPSIGWGQKIRLRSALGPPADGDWIALNITHNLDAEIPGGQWFTYVECGRDGYPTPIIG